jgi:murein DD-endopeptidase MepM/ murein hydrolase activator NlpD
MNGLCRRLLPASFVLACSVPGPLLAADSHVATVEAVPGGVVRWSAPGTKRCAMNGRSWAALGDTCYYPVDLLQKRSLLEIGRWADGPGQFAYIAVGAYPYPTQDIDLGTLPQANPSAEDLKRVWRDQALLNKVWKRKGPARFTLPLGAPASPLPEAKDFGAKRNFNGKPATQPHTGADYATPEGSTIVAIADGTVVVAEDLFFPGKAVFIDHGDGLISMYFHFSEFKVQAGQEVKKGDPLGLVDSTGRSTGPHLHFGIRWHGARINPQLLLEDPGKLPSVAP